MSVAAAPVLTTEELLALPEHGAERNRRHGRIVARVTAVLDAWLDQQPEPRGSVLSGKVAAELLVVEVLSPNDTQQKIHDKIGVYLRVGVPVVWVIDPHHRTVTIVRPDAEPEMVNVRQELSGEPHLPGFRVPVAQLFV
jgi:Uma2 family endonuclease